MGKQINRMVTLVQKYKSRAIRESGNELMLSLSDAKSLVEEAMAQGIAVTGIEGFRIRDGKVRPDLDMIAHFPADAYDSWQSRVSQSGRDALQFLDTLPQGDEGLCVIVGLRSEPE